MYLCNFPPPQAEDRAGELSKQSSVSQRKFSQLFFPIDVSKARGKSGQLLLHSHIYPYGYPSVRPSVHPCSICTIQTIYAYISLFFSALLYRAGQPRKRERERKEAKVERRRFAVSEKKRENSEAISRLLSVFRRHPLLDGARSYPRLPADVGLEKEKERKKKRDYFRPVRSYA